MTTLAEYLTQLSLREVSLLKIDVEGYERHVLQGFPWEEASARAVILEFEDAKARPLGYSWTDLAGELVARGYRVMVSEWFPLTAYGTAHRWRGFHEYPSELHDEMAWGNLLAVRAPNLPSLRAAAHQVAARLRRRHRAEAAVSRMRAVGGRAH